MTKPEAICPYCKQKLESIPQRRKKCPFCKNVIVPRTLPITRERVLVTKADAKKIDQEWAAYHFKNRWLGALASFGITENEFNRQKAQLSKQFDQDASDRDVIWALFNAVIQQKMQAQEFHNLKGLYYSMALFLNEERKDSFKIRQQSAKMALLNYKHSSGIKNVQILTAKDACEACQRVANQVWSIEDALKHMPIPVKDCTHLIPNDSQGFCRCVWTAYINKHPSPARRLNYCPRCGDPVDYDEYYCNKCGLKLRERH